MILLAGMVVEGWNDANIRGGGGRRGAGGRAAAVVWGVLITVGLMNVA